MDLGCYVLDAARHVGEWLGSAPQITSVEATLRAAQMDAAMRVELGYAHGVPHLDNRLLVTRNGITSQEILGDQTSYTYQLARFADALGADAPFPSGIDGSVANAELIDECYRRAGLTPRGA